MCLFDSRLWYFIYTIEKITETTESVLTSCFLAAIYIAMKILDYTSSALKAVSFVFIYITMKDIYNTLSASKSSFYDPVYNGVEITDDTPSVRKSSLTSFIYATVEVPIMLIVLVLCIPIGLFCYLFVTKANRASQSTTRSPKISENADFPSISKGGIVDEILKHLWRYMNSYVREELKSSLEKTIYEQYWVTLRSLDIGFKPDTLQTMFHLQPMHHNSNINLSVDFVCRGRCDASFGFWFIPLGGIDSFQIRGKLNIEICPTDRIPFIDAINIFLTELPLIDIDMYGLANWKKERLMKEAANQIYSVFVIPNKLQFPVSSLWANLITKKPY